MRKLKSKILLARPVIIKDKKNKNFVACLVERGKIVNYLSYLKFILNGRDWIRINQEKRKRDGDEYHVTIFSPYEFSEGFNLNTKIVFRLYGVGSVNDGKSKSFFIVAKSKDADFLRRRYKCKNKDFHLTIGFFRRDVHSLGKNLSTLI